MSLEIKQKTEINIWKKLFFEKTNEYKTSRWEAITNKQVRFLKKE